jgi:hypothetical protein
VHRSKGLCEKDAQIDGKSCSLEDMSPMSFQILLRNHSIPRKIDHHRGSMVRLSNALPCCGRGSRMVAVDIHMETGTFDVALFEGKRMITCRPGDESEIP